MSTSQHLFPSITPEQILEKLNAIAIRIQQAVDLEEILSQNSNELRDLVQQVAVQLEMAIQQDQLRQQTQETALKDSDQTLQAILNNAPFSIFMRDLQGRYLVTNPAYATLVNYSQEDLLGKTDNDIYPPEISAMCGQSDRAVLVSNQSITSEEIVPFNGKQHTYLVTKFTIPDAAGHPSALCGMAIDISDRKATEETLRQKLKRECAINLITQAIRNSLDLDTVFEATVMAIGKLLPVDRVSVTQYLPTRQVWQPIAEYRSSSSVPSALGIEISDVGNPLAARLKTGEIVCIDDTAMLEDEVNRTVAQIYPGTWLIAPLEIDTVIWGAVSIDCYERLRQWQTEEIDLISTIADQLGLAIQQATLYKQLQAERAALAQLNQDLEIKVSQRTDALRHSEALLQEAQAVSHLGNWELNIATGETTWSPETYRVFGLNPGQQTPTYAELSKFFDPDDWSYLDQLVARAIQFAEPYEADMRIIRADGSHGYIVAKAKPTCNAAGEVNRLFGIAMDISDRKQVEAQLRSSLQEKEVLLKEVHHRVKNNLQMISSLLSLQTNYIEDPELLTPFTESQRRIKVMALIHEKLYDSEDLAKIDFGEYISGLVDDLIQSYSRANIRWSVEVDSIELAVDLAIPGGLIVNELISNVVKHAFPHQRSGEISVQFKLHQAEPDCDRPDFARKANSSYYVLSVRDDGVGMPAALDFRNAESLGLQLVCELTRKLKGTIELDCSHGTMFKILFPPAYGKPRQG
jgi:PAS domain S-box-containing protein